MVCASGIMNQMQYKVELIYVYLANTQWISFLWTCSVFGSCVKLQNFNFIKKYFQFYLSQRDFDRFYVKFAVLLQWCKVQEI